MDIMLREFGRNAADARRTALYAAAIAAAVRPGDIVVDLGAGFGLLSLLAARRGAARVYAIEQGEHVALGREICRDNRLDSRITWIAGNSRQVVLPERADVVVSETLGLFALEEQIVEYLHDAQQRFLKPGGRMVPRALRMHLTPVELPSLRARLRREYGPQWRDVAGFDLRRLRQAVLTDAVTPYVPHAFGLDDRELGPRVELGAWQLGVDDSSRFLRDISCPIDQDGQLDGFLGTFTAELAPGVFLRTCPEDPPTHWGQVVLPVVPARSVAAGTRAGLTIGFHAGGRWSYAPRPSSITGGSPAARRLGVSSTA